MKKKSIVGIVLFIVGLFTTFGMTTFAESTQNNPTGNVKITTDIKNNTNTNLVDLDSIVTRLAYIEDENGAKYFCLDADKWYPYGNFYSASEILKNPITSWLLQNYYHLNQIISSQNEETRYAATQLAIWAITNPSKYADLPVITNNPIIMNLIAEANKHTNDLSAEEIIKRAEMALSPFSQRFKLSQDGSHYIAHLNTIPNDYLSSIEFLETSHFSFSYNGQDISKNITLKETENGQILSVDKLFFDSIYKYGVPLKIDLTSIIKGSFFVGIAYYTSDSRIQPLGSVENLTLEKSLAASAEIYLDRGQLKINKIDGTTKKPLAGATFTLKDINQTLIGTKTTNENGEILFDNLDFGQYLLEETLAPSGYENKQQTFNVTIDEKTPNLVYQLTVENKKQEVLVGEIKLIKTDEKTNTRLNGAEFSLLDKDQKIIDMKVTDKNGEISFSKLPFGTYYLKETKAPNGFVLDYTLHSVTINEKTPNLLHVITLTNKKKESKLGIIKLTKQASHSKKHLKDAEFALLNAEKETIEIKATDEDGNLQFSNLPFGTYYLKETKAPNGYLLDSKLYEVNLTEDLVNFTFHLTVNNHPKLTPTTKTPQPISKITSSLAKQLPQTGEELLNQVLLTLLGITTVYYVLIFKKKF